MGSIEWGVGTGVSAPQDRFRRFRGVAATALDLPAPTTFWNMNGSAGANEVDTVGGINATQHNTTGTAAGAGSGTLTCRSFVSTPLKQYFSVADTAAINLATTATVALWVYMNDKANYYRFLAKGDASGIDYLFYYDQGTDQLKFSFRNAANTVFEYVILSTPTVSVWRLLAAKWDGVNVSVSLNGAAWTAAANTTVPRSRVTTLGIGAEEYDADFVLNGRIDAVAIWKGTALTSAQIAAYYNAGSGREYSSGAWSP